MKYGFLTVADPHVGLGHLYRCDALATAFQLNGQEVELLIHCEAGKDWLSDFSIDCPWKIFLWKHNLSELKSIITKYDNVVIDAYSTNPETHELISSIFEQPVYFDDFGEYTPPKGIVINGSPGAHLINYPQRDSLTLLLGTDYQVLRQPFWKQTDRVVREKIETIGVMLGGTDHRGLMSRLIAILKASLSPEIKILAIGVIFLQTDCDEITCTGRLSAQGIKNTFDNIDLLITAGGQTVVEAVSCFLPTIMLETANNQRNAISGWSSLDVAIDSKVNLEKDEIGRISLSVHKSWTKEVREVLVHQTKKLSLHNSTGYLANRLIQKLHDF